MDSVDADAVKNQLESELRALEQWRDSAPTQEVLKVLKEQEEGLINLILKRSVDSIPAFFAHFEAVGHLRGLRYASSFVDRAIAEYTEKLKELQ